MSHAAGPYRSPLFQKLPPPARPWALGALVTVVLAAAAYALWPVIVPVPLEARDVPPGLVEDVSVFPPAQDELPVATPLAPLLASDAPDSLAVLSPGEGSLRLRRGEALTIRFNRPMVRATDVGRVTSAAPVVLSPRIEGAHRWSSRSSLTFLPDARAFDRSAEARLTFVEGLGSVDGEPLVDDAERLIVLDGTPRASEGPRQVAEGSPLEIHFDAPVSLPELMREMFVYERGGGARSLPASVRPRGWVTRGEGEDAPRSYVVTVDLRRSLLPGSGVSVALAPRFSPWSSGSPHVLSYDIEPRPSIDGIDCSGIESGWASCSYEESPGEIVDIGDALVLHATHPLAGSPGVTVVPAAPNLTVTIDESDAERAHYVTVRADWAADQVYELRLGAVATRTGARVQVPGALAIRSRGHAPEVDIPTGLLTFERDAELILPVRGIHVEDASILYAEVSTRSAMRELLGLAGGTGDERPTVLVMPRVLPSARSNRWGRGTLTLPAAEGPALYRVLAAHRASDDDDGDGYTFVRRALVQRTDMSIATLQIPGGVLVWVSSIASASPVAGVSVRGHDARGRSIARARTDGEGLAWLPTPRATTERPAPAIAALVAESGDDRALTLVDTRLATTGASLDLPGGSSEASPEEGRLRAIVRADRGLYRPGEALHVLGLLRWVRALSLTPRRASVEVRLVAGGEPIATASVDASEMGMVTADLRVPENAALGDATLEVAHAGVVLGSATVRIAQYREPRFRVDIDGARHVAARAGGELVVRGTYLFGAPVDGATVHATVTRATGASFAPRWREYAFAPAGTPVHRATVADEAMSLDASGSVHLAISGELPVPTRSVLTVEADVTDPAGQSSSGTAQVVVHPADVEVGIREGAEWVRFGEPLLAEVVAIDGDDAPVAGASLEVRFVREGWHSWWEWREEDERLLEDAPFSMRRARGSEVVHRCTLESGVEPVSCTLSPTRAGTYVIEVEARDAAGGRSLASRRLYVAGPDESPDRDPPGAPIALTPRRRTAMVGERVELAFECPWPEAEALVVVSHDGVLFTERRRVTAGGQVVSVPVTEAMAPNAFVTLTLVRPRTGEPEGALDVDAPDLRFGAAELVVRAPHVPLHVEIEPVADADDLRPGEGHEVTVRVTDGAGAPVAAEVALWATDEGTLRATDHHLGDLDEDLFPRLSAHFALDDGRRSLRSRIRSAVLADPSGDGGESGASPAMALEQRDRYEPTPMFVGHLRTDAEGRATATFEAPARLTEYRLTAVATDGEARVGSTTAQRVVTRPVLVRSALPRFLTEGDEAEARAFVHNRTDEEAVLDVVITVDGTADGAVRVTVPAHGEVAVPRTLRAPAIRAITVGIEARRLDGSVAHAIEQHVAVVPRGRWVRHRALVMGADGTRGLRVVMPEGTSSRGSLDAVVAAHPFIGLEAVADEVDDSAWATGYGDAAAALALASAMRLEAGSLAGAEAWSERRRRLSVRVERLVGRRSADGGIAIHPGEASDPATTLLAVRALIAASEAGIEVPPGAIDELTARLDEDVREGHFGGAMGAGGLTARISAIALLRARGRNVDAALESSFATREFLDAAGLSELALAMHPSDGRRATVVALAEQRGGIERPSPRTARLADRFRSLPELAGLIRLESTIEAHARADDPTRGTRRLLAPLGAELLGRLDGSSEEARAIALAALVELAARFRGPDAPVLSLALDSSAVEAERRSDVAAHFVLPFESVRTGEHFLLARRGSTEETERSPVFMSLTGLWTVPTGDADALARGRVVALHRIYETPGGTPIPAGTVLETGALVRVRLFVHVEGETPDEIALRDPHAAGLEPIDDALATSPNGALLSVLGASPEDDVQDPRAYHALRSEWLIRYRAHEAHATTFYLRAMSRGLHELTYVVRATTPGTFTVPPAQIEARTDAAFVARSTSTALVVRR